MIKTTPTQLREAMALYYKRYGRELMIDMGKVEGIITELKNQTKPKPKARNRKGKAK